MFAIISDIHGNLEALESVLEDIESNGIKDIICLGDIVGYGPNPEECIDIVSKVCRFCLCGNHDSAVSTDALNFNPIAARTIECTREIMRDGIKSNPQKQKRWDYLRNLPETMEEDKKLFVHGSPRDPCYEYILPTDVMFGLADKITEILGMIKQYCFVGHTHMPGVIDDEMRFLTPGTLGGVYTLGKSKAIINVSSVGQPRDGDNRSCYALVSEEKVVYRRVKYDFGKTMSKIKELPGVDDFVAERLAFGR